MKNDKIKSPHVSLKSSWVQVPFSKSKSAGPIIKKSLGNRSTAIIKDRGIMTTNATFLNSNQY